MKLLVGIFECLYKEKMKKWKNEKILSFLYKQLVELTRNTDFIPTICEHSSKERHYCCYHTFVVPFQKIDIGIFKIEKTKYCFDDIINATIPRIESIKTYCSANENRSSFIKQIYNLIYQHKVNLEDIDELTKKLAVQHSKSCFLNGYELMFGEHRKRVTSRTLLWTYSIFQNKK